MTVPREAAAKSMADLRAWSFCGELIPFAVFTVDGQPSVFIPRRAGGPALIELVFALDELALRGGNVGRESEQEVVGNPLLHRDTSARIGVVSAQRRVDRQARKAGELLDSTAHLTCRTLRQKRTGSEVGR